MRGGGTQVPLDKEYGFRLPDGKATAVARARASASASASVNAPSTPAVATAGPSRRQSRISTPGSSRRVAPASASRAAPARAPISSTPARGKGRVSLSVPAFDESLEPIGMDMETDSQPDDDQDMQLPPVYDDEDVDYGAPGVSGVDISLPRIPSPDAVPPRRVQVTSSRGRGRGRGRGRPPGRPAPATATAAAAAAATRRMVAIPADDSVASIQTTATATATAAAIPRTERAKTIQRRLKRALSLALPERKKQRHLNDADVIWSVVDEELRTTTASQPVKRVAAALKAVRTAVKDEFTRISAHADERTHLLTTLVRARRLKKALRREVYETRTEVVRSETIEAERRRELETWRKHSNQVREVQGFLEKLRTQAQAWT